MTDQSAAGARADDSADRVGETDPARGVYAISVASDLVGTGVQNLRAYERAGLLTPERTAGGTRLYSADDVDRLRRIQRLLAAGLNLAGIARVLDLEDHNAALREQLDAAHDRLDQDAR